MKNSQVIAGLFLFFVGGLTGTGISYGTSKTDVLREVEDVVLSSDVDDDIWKIAHNKLKNLKNKTIIKDEKLKLISNDTSDSLSLKDWCSNKYSSTFRSLFNKGDKSDLEEVKKWCYLSVEDVVVGSESNSKKELLRNKSVVDKYTWTALRNVAGLTLEDDEEIISIFDDEIKGIWNSLKNESSEIEDLVEKLSTTSTTSIQKYKDQAKSLVDWCVKNYDRKFVSKNDNNYKTVENLCILIPDSN